MDTQTLPPKGKYAAKRQHLLYYRYVEQIVLGVAQDAKSILDVGAASTSCIEAFDWAEQRDTLDIKTPYSSPNVRGITADFLQFKPERRYDLVTCLQVLEHIPDVQAFARKLFDVGDSVLISVPYKWPSGVTNGHIPDPVDRKKLQQWTNRTPAYDIVVTEPLKRVRHQRLIAYYPREGEPFSGESAYRRMRELFGQRKRQS